MARFTGRCIVPALALALLGGCAKYQSKSEQFGHFTLESKSWTVPGPCPKHHSEHNLVAPDGKVVIEFANWIGTTRDGDWSLWRGGPSTALFAIDHRHDVVRELPSAESTAADWFRPGTQQLALLSNQGSSVEIVLCDLALPDVNRTFVHRTWGDIHALAWSPDGSLLAVCEEGGPPPKGKQPPDESDHVVVVAWSGGKPHDTPLRTTEGRVFELQWSGSGRTLALLESIGEAQPSRCRLLHVRSFAPPDVVMPDVVVVEEQEFPAKDGTIAWQDEAPRLRRR